MDSWYKPSGSCYTQPPVRQFQRNPKILSVPVHFVGSETTRSASASKIQKVFRGFLIRKSVKQILAIDRQVEEIEGEISRKRSMDTKERLRVNEELMNLLFKLDSIRGVYPGIRECRKAVTKKVVAIQEMVDRMASEVDIDTSSAVDCIVSAAVEKEDVDMDDSNCSVDESVDQSNLVECQGTQSYARFCKPNSVCTEDVKEIKPNSVGTEDVKEIVEDCSLNEGCREKKYIVRKEQCSKEGKEEEDVCKGNKEIMDKMMAENEKMIKLISHICERSEMQTHMLASLMQRVERLEKAFICSTKLKKKRKKTNHNAS